ncbi:voltage-gated potassium channel [Mesoflavibacter sabulilitoris]|uniref:Ion transporter n=1 Tax=Mesoflavibacter zeaxanthinifaciens subsp. sabulilitoris TaxID=1520893 RepID=A0A2T1NH46_9FLAO|nr:ion transporter [Mesoflavibacter zeaxanthinifaciens]MBB3122714.1 voltage-gated potassium channel [Mesoflavibacter zeaxanthinifaciens subsp. sabulilitoris]PSG92198.1 ion transporter [Mesoflavibacter zeaxanthinifaciens subsp. sabulilitoris]
MKANKQNNWKEKLHEIIYEADTPAGKLFDIILLLLIITSIILVMLESVEEFAAKYIDFLNAAEWVITVLFTIEYIARITVVTQPKKYIFSFYGVVDLLSTIPKYLSFFILGSHSLIAFRALRLMRVFRILKLARYVGESNNLIKALRASRAKIAVFVFFVLIVCVILGAVMYIVESGQDSGFTSIPRSVYWAIVTLTTVGYGDIAPATALGQLISSIIMIIGYGVIAIPTGIVSVEYSKNYKENTQTIKKPTVKQIRTNTQTCSNCLETDHDNDANFCKTCGNNLH